MISLALIFNVIAQSNFSFILFSRTYPKWPEGIVDSLAKASLVVKVSEKRF
jgi:hypothetical protein